MRLTLFVVDRDLRRPGWSFYQALNRRPTMMRWTAPNHGFFTPTRAERVLLPHLFGSRAPKVS